MKQKLELTWIGKGDSEPAVEPRILIHDSTKDCGDPNSGNMLIHGDNLLVLKALESNYTGKVKLIYIDPPYNAKIASDFYDDNVEHSIWLSIMKPRLELMRNLLTQDGTIWIQIDDKEYAYLKVLCDEVFGRSNFLTSISVKMSHLSGVKMSHVDKTLPKLKEYILVFCKEKKKVKLNPQFEKCSWDEAFDRYTKFIIKDPISPDDILRWSVTTVKKAAEEYGVSLQNREEYDKFRMNHADCIFRTAPSKSLEFGHCPADGKFRYIRTKEGKSKLAYMREEVLLCSQRLKEIDGKMFPVLPIGDIWGDAGINNLHQEGGVQFKNGKKPEKLIMRVLSFGTQQGDLVLDSFLGSGTTAAVAHKMGRRYIGIERGDHCYSHCKIRLDRVISGEDSGISKEVQWKGGGGYKFYELAPSLIEKDKYGNSIISKSYDLDMIVRAVGKLNGYKIYAKPDVFWKQGYSQDRSYIYVTTNYVDSKMLDSIASEIAPMEKLLICAPAYDNGLNKKYNNIQIRKIPQSVLNMCDYEFSDNRALKRILINKNYD